MAFGENSIYNKFRAKECGCEDKSKCSCKDSCKEDECGCCPVGLVAVEDNGGKHIACLTPADAQEYMKTTYRCPDGYIRVTDEDTGDFIACLSPADFATYRAALA